MQEIIAALVSFFLIEPVQENIAERYAAAGISAQAASRVASCFSRSAPGILDRAGNDPAWAIAHAVGYWTGTTTVNSILSDAAPECVEVVDNAQGSTATVQ